MCLVVGPVVEAQCPTCVFIRLNRCFAGGRLWSSVVVCGRLWSSMVVCDCPWLSVHSCQLCRTGRGRGRGGRGDEGTKIEKGITPTCTLAAAWAKPGASCAPSTGTNKATDYTPFVLYMYMATPKGEHWSRAAGRICGVTSRMELRIRFACRNLQADIAHRIRKDLWGPRGGRRRAVQ